MFRPSRGIVGALALVVTACSDNNNNFVGVPATASIRLVNDTDNPLTLTSPGFLNPPGGPFTFGQASACVIVDLATTTVPPLTVMNQTTGASVTITPALSVGDNMLVVAFGNTTGSVQLTTLSNRFVPAANAAGVRFFNGTSSNTAPLLMRRNDVVLTPFVDFGAASPFVSVPIDSASITFSTANSIVFDAGPMAFPLGQNSTVVLGPPASGTIPLRVFTVQGC
jgi:hypothetical protein